MIYPDASNHPPNPEWTDPSGTVQASSHPTVAVFELGLANAFETESQAISAKDSLERDRPIPAQPEAQPKMPYEVPPEILPRTLQNRELGNEWGVAPFSPETGQSSIPSSPPWGRSIQALLSHVVKQAKGLVAAKHLPWIAKRLCHTYLDREQADLQATCQLLLQKRLELNPQQLQNFLHTPMGNTLLTTLSQVFSKPSPIATSQSPDLPENWDNLDFPASRSWWRTLLVSMASEAHGITILSLVKALPKTLQLNTHDVLNAVHQLETLWQKNEQILAGLKVAARAEAKQGPIPNYAQLPDLRIGGPFDVTQLYFEVRAQVESSHLPSSHSFPTEDPALDEEFRQQRLARTIRTVLYYPSSSTTEEPLNELLPDPLPVIVISHGLASSPDDFADYAYHLASHGYAIALPQHPGSDVTQIHRMLSGESSEVLAHTEFLHRPLDISDVLDELERLDRSGDHKWPKPMDLERVGVIGSSFGAYTALVLAGATIQRDTLAEACDPFLTSPNVSLLLQCRALHLPQTAYSLKDSRIAAVVTMDAVGSALLGQKGIASVNVPVMMIAGSSDTTAPLALEQMRLFQWLQVRKKYLGLMIGKSHIRNWDKWKTSLQLQLNIFPEPKPGHSAIFDTYIKALTLALFNVHLKQKEGAIAYLHSAYGQYLSHSPAELVLLTQFFDQWQRACHPAQDTKQPFWKNTKTKDSELGSTDSRSV